MTPISLYDVKNQRLFAIFKTHDRAGRYVFGKAKAKNIFGYTVKQSRSLAKSNMLGIDVAFRYTSEKDMLKLQEGHECWIEEGYKKPDWNINKRFTSTRATFAKDSQIRVL